MLLMQGQGLDLFKCEKRVNARAKLEHTLEGILSTRDKCRNLDERTSIIVNLKFDKSVIPERISKAIFE